LSIGGIASAGLNSGSTSIVPAPVATSIVACLIKRSSIISNLPSVLNTIVAKPMKKAIVC